MPKNNMGLRLEFKTAKADKKGEVMIYSVISSTRFWGDELTSRDFDAALKDLGDVDEITVRINSPGGAVNEAIAMRTALMKHSAKKIVDIEGSCCSAATLIACMPGATVRMAKGSDYMIHRCSWAVRGHAADMLSAYHSMINTDNDIADIYAERTGMTRDECLELMDKTTWYNVDQALSAGFVDEVIDAAEGDEGIAACAVSEEMYKVMQEMYGNVPELPVAHAEPEQTPDNNVSNEKTAVAAGNSSENTGKEPKEGGTHMELRDATAEVIQQENPEAAQAITDAAITAERARVAKIRKLTRKGAKWEAMRDKAIDEGMSPDDYLEAVIAEEEKAGQTYLEQRANETRTSGNVGGGDSGDVDNNADLEDRIAKEIADLAKEMNPNTTEMA